MNYYVVNIKIQTGEYEKNSLVLLQALNKVEAEKEALLAECHGEIDVTAEWTQNGGIADLGWEFHYSIGSCKEVKAEHVGILTEYIN